MDYENILSRKVQDLQFSGIRKFFDIAASYDDVISLSVGEPDFKTPWAIRKEAIRVLEKGRTNYTANAGLADLRIAINDYINDRLHVSYDPMHEILVTVGGSEAIDLAIRALIDTGDEVLIPQPSFVCYGPIVTLANGTPVAIETTVENGFKLTAEALKAHITPKTKALVLPYPNNPTGAVMRKSDLEAIAEVIRGTDIIVISDEIYSELTYGNEEHCSYKRFLKSVFNDRLATRFCRRSRAYCYPDAQDPSVRHNVFAYNEPVRGSSSTERLQKRH